MDIAEGIWSVNFFLIAPFPDHCLPVPFSGLDIKILSSTCPAGKLDFIAACPQSFKQTLDFRHMEVIFYVKTLKTSASAKTECRLVLLVCDLTLRSLKIQ